MINRCRVSLSEKRYIPRSVSESWEIFYFKLVMWVIPLGVIYKALECFTYYESDYPVWSKVGFVAICIPIAFLGDWMEKKVEIHFDSRIRKTLLGN